MTMQITFKNMTHSDLMADHAKAKMAKIMEFLAHEPTPVHIELIFAPSHVHEHHKVELLVKTPSYHEFVSFEKEGMPFYETLDHVIDVMYRNLLKAKQRRVDDRKHAGRPDKKL